MSLPPFSSACAGRLLSCTVLYCLTVTILYCRILSCTALVSYCLVLPCTACPVDFVSDEG